MQSDTVYDAKLFFPCALPRTHQGTGVPVYSGFRGQTGRVEQESCPSDVYHPTSTRKGEEEAEDDS